MAQVLPVIDERREGTLMASPPPFQFTHLPPNSCSGQQAQVWDFLCGLGNPAFLGCHLCLVDFLGLYCQSLLSSSCIFATVN